MKQTFCPLAVVAMAGRFPGAANVEELWCNLKTKRDVCGPVPPRRWSAPPEMMVRPDFTADYAYCRNSFLLDDFRPPEIPLDSPGGTHPPLDPSHQLILEVGRQLFEAYPRKRCPSARTAVILAAIALPTEGASRLSAAIFGHEADAGISGAHHSDPSPGPGPNPWVTTFPGSLLAQTHGFTAGGYTLDAACASSLYAVKLAHDQLAAGRVDAVVAGGLSHPDCLYTQVGFSQLRALSPSGRCAPFDASADGLVVGEGAGLVILKRLADAQAAGDPILGVIRGIGLSNDMAGNLLAPEAAGQLRALEAAYAVSGWRPDEVDHIECHGAGTPRGDATELTSLGRLWARYAAPGATCPLGAVKSTTGHLLTAAGAAGLIKTLLALKHASLPPTANFQSPRADSPLSDGPFRVLTQAEPWSRRTKGTPRRAAVNAFGFGGINAHLLVEEWLPDKTPRHLSRGSAENQAVDPPLSPLAATVRSAQRAPIKQEAAIVGIAVHCGESIQGLDPFRQALFQGRSAIAPRPRSRSNGIKEQIDAWLGRRGAQGAFLDQLTLDAGKFRIPPKEIADILPQHLLMLKVAAEALADAGMAQREARPRMGAIVGMAFDYGATDFTLRWRLRGQGEKLLQARGCRADRPPGSQWLDQAQESLAPPLTAPRTLGALGGVIAGRLAREFKFGGPSFVVSQGAASGMVALEIARRFLQTGELEAVVVGAVDICGDLRHLAATNRLQPYSRGHRIRPFDRDADGTLPGEGAVSLVLKPLVRAQADGDRIYAVVPGSGHASPQNPAHGDWRPTAQTYGDSLSQALAEAGLRPDQIQLVETHGSGTPQEDRAEIEALTRCWGEHTPAAPCALGAAKPITGHTGSAAGLFSVAKTALCLHHAILAPLAGFERPASAYPMAGWHLPHQAQYWAHNRQEGPRRALVGAITRQGHCAHLVLEAAPEAAAATQPSPAIFSAAPRPLGGQAQGLISVGGADPEDLLARLDELKQWLAGQPEGAGGEDLARAWFTHTSSNAHSSLRAVIRAENPDSLGSALETARRAISRGEGLRLTPRQPVAYSPRPLGPKAPLAWVYPGSGNHFVGMGRELALCFPELMAQRHRTTPRLKDQLLPELYMPQGSQWEAGWQAAAQARIDQNPLGAIFGQVMFGSLMSDLLRCLGITPQAVIGYSLGESAGLFATGAWTDLGAMEKRMQASDLFRDQLAGECRVAHQAWGLDPDQDPEWRVAVINRPADQVRPHLWAWPRVALLIINTPKECVIGGHGPDVRAVIEALQCNALWLPGVVTVHNPLMAPVAQAYRDLHLFDTTPLPGVAYYSCAKARAYDVTPESAADSILAQAWEGFDFSALIRRAYANGVRIFVEMGPQASCTRMIGQILEGEPHLAVSASVKEQGEYATLLNMLGNLMAEGIAVDLAYLYGGPPVLDEGALEVGPSMAGRQITLPIARPRRPLPPLPAPKTEAPPLAAPEPGEQVAPPSADQDLMAGVTAASAATSRAHERFLDLSREIQGQYGAAFELHNDLLTRGLAQQGDPPLKPAPGDISGTPPAAPSVPPPAYPRELCIEFAVGSAAKVLGEEFAPLDRYPVRVRLPDEPLMLVDRIMNVSGEKGSLTSGRVVTEHDVHPGAWYLDGGRAPVCIAVEAGQADLFLCSYMGIDFKVQGKRAYRLLDATVTFHRQLPRPGETIRYEIAIDKFIRQGPTYLFRFRFEGYIDGTKMITMTNGCAGFFTPEETANSGGILERDMTPAIPEIKGEPLGTPLVPMAREQYSEGQLEALRQGDAAACFGLHFEGIQLPANLRIPGGTMKLIHRILDLDPAGGLYGRGLIRAEADIHPQDWFLTCHFVDDPTMPGTLMYECCAHTLRVLLLRQGWITDRADVGYEPVPGVHSILKCRGPVTPDTKKVIYEVHVHTQGFRPEPFVVADAVMYADGHRIVHFKDMAMRMPGLTRKDLKQFWAGRTTLADAAPAEPLFTKAQLLEFASGSPSAAFGPPYEPFDRDRFIARLPRPPYLCMDRVLSAEPEPWVLKPGGWATAQFDIDPGHWYFRANRTPALPFAWLLEIALQPCGWLAAYMGSALKSTADLKFRNLGGEGIIHRSIPAEKGTLTTRVRLTQTSGSGEMIIEHYQFQVLWRDDPVYEGTTYFGFFTPQALADQKGIRAGTYNDPAQNVNPKDRIDQTLTLLPPVAPEDETDIEYMDGTITMPGKALAMIDVIDTWDPRGGPHGLGYIKGRKTVNPEEWFFKAHFYQDPVCPGSLGLESFLQLLRYAGIQRFQPDPNRYRVVPLTGMKHKWTYRGQILSTNKEIAVEGAINRISDTPYPVLVADGILQVDGLVIYSMENLGVVFEPIED